MNTHDLSLLLDEIRIQKNEIVRYFDNRIKELQVIADEKVVTEFRAADMFESDDLVVPFGFFVCEEKEIYIGDIYRIQLRDGNVYIMDADLYRNHDCIGYYENLDLELDISKYGNYLSTVTIIDGIEELLGVPSSTDGISKIIAAIERKKVEIVEYFNARTKELQQIADDKGIAEFGFTKEDIEESIECGDAISIGTYVGQACEESNYLSEILQFKLEEGEVYVTYAYLLFEDGGCAWLTDQLDILLDLSTHDNFLIAAELLECVENQLGIS